MATKDLYKLLGVNPGASDREIRGAYRRLLRKHHPDVYRGDAEVASANTRELTAAYDVLIDPVRRREYDQDLQAQARAPRSSSSDPFQPRTIVTNAGPRGETVIHASSPTSPSGAPYIPWDRRGGSWQRTPTWLLEERATHRQVRRVLLTVLVGLVIFVAVAATLPVARSFSFNVGPDGPSYGYCGMTQSFPSGAQVTFTWTTDVGGLAALNGPPQIVVFDPYGNYVLSSSSANGSASFVSQSGLYTFENWNCQSVSPVIIAGHFTAPLL